MGCCTMISKLKTNYKIIFLVLAVLFVVTATIKITPIQADPEETESTGKDTESSNVNLKTSNFYTSAIASIDSEIRKKEDGQNYIDNFSNSTGHGPRAADHRQAFQEPLRRQQGH